MSNPPALKLRLCNGCQYLSCWWLWFSVITDSFEWLRHHLSISSSLWSSLCLSVSTHPIRCSCSPLLLVLALQPHRLTTNFNLCSCHLLLSNWLLTMPPKLHPLAFNMTHPQLALTTWTREDHLFILSGNCNFKSCHILPIALKSTITNHFRYLSRWWLWFKVINDSSRWLRLHLLTKPEICHRVD